MSKIKGLLEDSKLPLTDIVHFDRFAVWPVRGFDEHDVPTDDYAQAKRMECVLTPLEGDHPPVCFGLYGVTIGEDIGEEKHIADFDTPENAREFLRRLATLFSIHEVAEAHGWIATVWGVEDVRSQAKQDGIELTDEQCTAILQEIRRTHDTTIGVNWEVVSAAIDAHLN